MARVRRRPRVWLALLALSVGAGFGLYWFQPWKRVTDQQVNETLAVPSVSQASAGSPEPAVTRQGAFISHEHETRGLARVIRTAAGSYRLELVGLDTSNGPDLRVWLSDQPVRDGVAGWRVFDDGTWVELGRLKGNKGDQAYDIPAGTDLDRPRSVTIWCKRFSVSFGAAPLTATS